MVRVACVVLVALLLPARAHATCDGCCDLKVTLVGWSTDGTRHAVIRTWETGEKELVLSEPGRERRWSSVPSAAAEDALCVGNGKRVRDVARLDVRRWKLARVEPSWRTEFDKTIQIAAVGLRKGKDAELGEWECPAWELKRETEVVAVFPRKCADALPIGGSEVLGGYLMPGGKLALVKLAIHHAGLSDEQRFVKVPLP